MAAATTRRHRPARGAAFALCGALVALAAPWPEASAMTLGEAYLAARTHDPQQRAAERELDASRMAIDIARASLLPQVSLSVSHSEVGGSRTFPNAANQEVRTRVEYGAPSATLGLRAPLYNPEAWARLKQVKLQVSGAEETLRARTLDTVDRVAQVYLLALLSRTALQLADSEEQALREQVRRVERRLERGEGTRTDVARTTAALEVARYRVLEARDQMRLAVSRLHRTIGRTPAALQDSADDFRLAALQPLDARAWVERALDQSPLVRARRMAVEAARANVERNRAGHLPRVDLVSNVSQSRNESLSNLNQTSTLRSIGVQLSVPLFSGFGTEASVKQAMFDLERLEEELRNERDNVAVEVMRLYRLLDSGTSRLDALRASVAAAEVAVTGAVRAFEAGLGTQTDVLDARSRVYSSRVELAQARNDQLLAYVRLLATAGEPPLRPIEEIDRVLAQQVSLPSFTQPDVTP